MRNCHVCSEEYPKKVFPFGEDDDAPYRALSDADVSGPPLRATGPPLCASGPPQRVSGPPLRTGGLPLHASGPPLRASGPPLRASGSLLRASGPPLRASGPPLRASGRPVRASGPPVRASASGPRSWTAAALARSWAMLLCCFSCFVVWQSLCWKIAAIQGGLFSLPSLPQTPSLLSNQQAHSYRRPVCMVRKH